MVRKIGGEQKITKKIYVTLAGYISLTERHQGKFLSSKLYISAIGSSFQRFIKEILAGKIDKNESKRKKNFDENDLPGSRRMPDTIIKMSLILSKTLFL